MPGRRRLSGTSIAGVGAILIGLLSVGTAGAAATDGPEPAGAAGTAPVSSPGEVRADELDLRGRVIDTATGEEPRVPAALRRADDGPEQLWLVQFEGPIQPKWIDGLAARGLALVQPVPLYGYVVRGDAAAIDALRDWGRADSPVHYTGPFRPAYRLSPALSGKDAPAADEPVDVVVQVVGGDRDARVAARSVGTPLAGATTAAGLTNIEMRVLGRDLVTLASQPGVVNVEPRTVPQRNDEAQDQAVAGNLTTSGAALVPTGPGYLAFLAGEGVSTDPTSHPVVAVVDDGVDNGTSAPLHNDFRVGGNGAGASRLLTNTNCTTDAGNPTASGVAGHGNINAGIVGGFNNANGYPNEDASLYNYGLGVDPYARLANVKIFRDSGSFDTAGCAGGTYQGIVNAVVAAGAPISNNSWGANASGAYTASSQQYDAFTRDSSSVVGGLQPVLHVFSAGNAGPGAVTLGAPGTAKNVLTVGATENVRDQGVADGCSVSAADSVADMATFSSRGPASDLRAKPDIVAPGTHVQGPASQVAGYTGDGVCGPLYYPAAPVQTLYTWSSGTSHSAPAVAGAAALAFEYYGRSLSGGVAPSPAMLKALLLNSPRYLDGADTGGTLPGSGQGWGHVDLAAMSDPTRWVRDQAAPFTASGQAFAQTFQIVSSGQPTRITLAYTDAPGSTVGNSYVNDLDLNVVAGGQVYRGNAFAGGTSVPGGVNDARNNVEQVWLPAGLNGTVTIQVRATNIAGDGVPGGGVLDQDFALTSTNLSPTAGGPSIPNVAAVTFSDVGAGANGNGSIEPGEPVRTTMTLENLGATANPAGTVEAEIVAGPGVVLSGPVPTPEVPSRSVGVPGPLLQVTAGADCLSTVTVRFTYRTGGQTATKDVTFSTSQPPNAPWGPAVVSADVPKAIPDNNPAGATSTLTATGPAQLAGLRVTFSATHTWDSDLTFTLTGPGAQTATLVARRGGSGDNFTNTVLDDAAATPIATGAAPFTGTFRPETPLSVFVGTDATGTWSLKAVDSASSDTGSITAWQIETRSPACPAVPPGGLVQDPAAAATEGAALVFPVVRTGATIDPLVVSVRTQDGTATAGADYTATSTQVTVPAGATSTTVSVPTLPDASTEPAETVQLVLDAVSGGGGVVRSPATGVIADGPVVNPPPVNPPPVNPPNGGDATLPGSPTTLKAKVKGAKVKLTWRSPATGSAPTSYRVQRSVTDKKHWRDAASVSTTTFVWKKAKPGKRYFFRVAALNGAGQGPFSKALKVKVR